MTIDKIKQKLISDKEQRYSECLKYWQNRKPFINEHDIPDIPITSKEDYKNIIIPNIIRCGGIPKSELIIHKIYIGSCRNTTEAEWTGKNFIYCRHKFGTEFIDEINHFEDDDGYDLFIPIKVKD